MFIICCGMYRSCSTWQYLVAAELVESYGRGRRLGFIDGSEFLEKGSQLLHSNEMFVLKCHDFHSVWRELIETGSAKTIYAYRDIRDVACSLRWKLKMPFERIVTSEALQAAINSYYEWIAVPHGLIQQYEAIIGNPVTAVQQIADHLEIAIDIQAAIKIAQEYNLGANLSRTRQLTEALVEKGKDLGESANALLHDADTLLHWNHIRTDTPTDWRTELSHKELLSLYPVVSRWLIDVGLEKDDGWLSQPIETNASASAGQVKSTNRKLGTDHLI